MRLEEEQDAGASLRDIAIEDDDVVLAQLLFARDVWRLPVGRRMPAGLEPDPGLRLDAPFDAGDLVARWEQDFSARLAFLADARRAAAPTDLLALREWLAAQTRPWDLVLGDFFPSREYWSWSATRLEAGDPRRPRPEADTLPELVRASEAGLARVIVLPLAGRWHAALGHDALLVSAGTRADPAAYAAALAGR